MKLKEIKKKVKIPENVKLDTEGTMIKISGQKGQAERRILDKGVIISKEGDFIIIKSVNVNKNSKRAVGTITSLIKNMIRGVSEGYEYKLKICSSHFPMNVSLSGKELLIKNFLGEKNPRKCRIRGNVEIQLNKDEITLKGISNEAVGQAAADIEQTTRISNKDRRIFQDGIYITSKP